MFFGDEQLKCACLFNADAFSEEDKESNGSLCCCCGCRVVGRDDANSSGMRGDLLNSFDFGAIGRPRFCCSRLCIAFGVLLDWESATSEVGIAVLECETTAASGSLFCLTDSSFPFSSISLSVSATAPTVDEFMCHFLCAMAKTSS